MGQENKYTLVVLAEDLPSGGRFYSFGSFKVNIHMDVQDNFSQTVRDWEHKVAEDINAGFSEYMKDVMDASRNIHFKDVNINAGPKVTLADKQRTIILAVTKKGQRVKYWDIDMTIKGQEKPVFTFDCMEINKPSDKIPTPVIEMRDEEFTKWVQQKDKAKWKWMGQHVKDQYVDYGRTHTERKTVERPKESPFENSWWGEFRQTVEDRQHFEEHHFHVHGRQAGRASSYSHRVEMATVSKTINVAINGYEGVNVITMVARDGEAISWEIARRPRSVNDFDRRVVNVSPEEWDDLEMGKTLQYRWDWICSREADGYIVKTIFNDGQRQYEQHGTWRASDGGRNFYTTGSDPYGPEIRFTRAAHNNKSYKAGDVVWGDDIRFEVNEPDPEWEELRKKAAEVGYNLNEQEEPRVHRSAPQRKDEYEIYITLAGQPTCWNKITVERVWIPKTNEYKYGSSIARGQEWKGKPDVLRYVLPENEFCEPMTARRGRLYELVVNCVDTHVVIGGRQQTSAQVVEETVMKKVGKALQSWAEDTEIIND